MGGMGGVGGIYIGRAGQCSAVVRLCVLCSHLSHTLSSLMLYLCRYLVVNCCIYEGVHTGLGVML